jgi:protein-tyrosine phosphatase
MNPVEKIKVQFVCMGNICRSPTAEGVFRKLVEDQALSDVIEIDSSGTHAYHVGESPDRRAQAAALKREIDLSLLRGRQFDAEDYGYFNYILAMDRANFNDIRSKFSGEGEAQVFLFMDFAESYSENEVPDPYYGGVNGFERVLDMVQDAANGLLQYIRKQHGI